MAGRPRIPFQTKVLVPTVLVMALLQILLMWVVNERFSMQFTNQALQNLNRARDGFAHSEENRSRAKIQQYQAWASEPKVKSLFLNAAQNAETFKPTLQSFLQHELIDQFRPAPHFVAYTTPDGKTPLVVTSDPALRSAMFGLNMARSVQQALTGESDVHPMRIGAKVYDVVSIPVTVDEQTAGVLSIGDEIGEQAARDMKQFTTSEIAIICGGRVVASSLADESLFRTIVETYDQFAAAKGNKEQEVFLGNIHYKCRAEPFEFAVPDPTSGYLLLASYETALQESYSTQRMLLAVGLCAIIAGSLTVWLIVRKLTKPIRELRDGAEAVGRGDFDHKVNMDSNDECGELAEAFNQMTSNLQRSHAELEKAVDTLKNTQAQLIQREKLSAIGQFVAGVTHELNNPLTVVIGLAELLQMIDPDSKHKKHLDNIMAGAQRCQKIVKSLLSFARQHPTERKLVNVNDLVDATLTFMQYEMRTSNIEVEREFASELPAISADPHQIQQVFLNIVNNARQAMETLPAGKLKVSSARIGNNIRITFADSGPGISEANVKKLFTPFFTTKEMGKGTGLGLSLSYGIVQEHGGEIHVESTVGKGTSFHIDLPIAVALGHIDSQPETAPFTEQLKKGNGKRILAVDDEEHILELIRDTLSATGYSVDVTTDGQTALDRLHQTKYDLTLCDLKMPGLNGQQIYERLRASNPAAAAKIVFMTGDVINDRTRDFFSSQNAFCISKPFSLHEFQEVVATMSSQENGGMTTTHSGCAL
jgi:two-component system NtrC family sensor kinase